MIKATAGGGGRGMRLAMEEKDFMRLLQQAQQEADAAFGNPDMYLERFVNNPRHIEFQVHHSVSLHEGLSRSLMLQFYVSAVACSCPGDRSSIIIATAVVPQAMR